jgi:protein-S-isoprenylcysteine O-methyltransferase Ste14
MPNTLLIMHADLPYRITIIAIAAIHLAVSLQHAQRAEGGQRFFGPRMEGPFLAWGTLAFLLLYATTVLVYLINPAWMTWAAPGSPVPLRWAGGPLMALGAALHLWGSHHLGTNLTVTISTTTGHRLVTSGPYRWVRHPLYTGGMLESLGVCLLLPNYAVAAGAVGFWGLVILRTKKEEAILFDTFGEAYRNYQAHTGRFLPRWSEDKSGAY